MQLWGVYQSHHAALLARIDSCWSSSTVSGMFIIWCRLCIAYINWLFDYQPTIHSLLLKVFWALRWIVNWCDVRQIPPLLGWLYKVVYVTVRMLRMRFNYINLNRATVYAGSIPHELSGESPLVQKRILNLSLSRLISPPSPSRCDPSPFECRCISVAASSSVHFPSIVYLSLTWIRANL